MTSRRWGCHGRGAIAVNNRASGRGPWGLQADQPISDLIGPLEEYLNHTGQQTARRQLLDDARRHHETELQLSEAVGDARSQAVTYHQFGVVALEQQRFDEAEASYRQALESTWIQTNSGHP